MITSRADLECLLADILRARVAVLGDYCLDAYWFVNMSHSEVSLETGIDTHPVQSQRYSLGGAGNVVANIVALGCGSVAAFGVVGDDPWGKELTRLLAERGVDTSALLAQQQDWATLTYIKPHIADIEQNRIDFGNFNALSEDTADLLLANLEQRLDEFDIVVVNQQVIQGVHSPRLRHGLNDLMLRRPETPFIVDSRHYTDSYPNAVLKVNDHEAARLCGVQRDRDQMVLREEAVNAAESLFARTGKPVFVTRGSRGCLVRDEAGLHEIPGIQILGRIDTVGAGDSVLAGIAAAMAVGTDAVTAAMLGSFGATVTIQKLRQTGTASPEEILAVGSDPDYIYRPELAEDTRQARIIPETEFEIVTGITARLSLKHAIFDHDGTISTLRQGWESIMEPMMVRSILGPQYESADESLYHRVVDRVRDFIDRSTGIRTIEQMRMLVEIVREFGCVPASAILDEHGYKRIYNAGLMRLVMARIDKLRRGELSVEDYTVKNAPYLLKRLSDAGVCLYLASGTDQHDLETEAEALGYAGLFEGRIYGAEPGAPSDAKKMVLERIMADLGENASGGLVTFGDGPVEIRETRKRGGLAIGVASDEVRRYGLNESKRPRLIRAGADVIVPDFAQADALLGLLNIV